MLHSAAAYLCDAIGTGAVRRGFYSEIYYEHSSIHQAHIDRP